MRGTILPVTGRAAVAVLGFWEDLMGSIADCMKGVWRGLSLATGGGVGGALNRELKGKLWAGEL